MRNSGFREHTLNASEAPGPECHRTWAWLVAHDWSNTTFFRKVCSEDEGNRVATHPALLGRFPEIGRPSSNCATQIFRQNLACPTQLPLRAIH